MATVGSKWNIEVTEIKQLGSTPREDTGLHTYVVSGVATSTEGDVHHFAARNNLDNKARMPEEVGHGFSDEDKASSNGISGELYMGRGARIAIARLCKTILGRHLESTSGRSAVVKAFKEAQEEDAS
jgi:hypothetical protein